MENRNRRRRGMGCGRGTATGDRRRLGDRKRNERVARPFAVQPTPESTGQNPGYCDERKNCPYEKENITVVSDHVVNEVRDVLDKTQVRLRAGVLHIPTSSWTGAVSRRSSQFIVPFDGDRFHDPYRAHNSSPPMDAANTDVKLDT